MALRKEEQGSQAIGKSTSCLAEFTLLLYVFSLVGTLILVIQGLHQHDATSLGFGVVALVLQSVSPYIVNFCEKQ